MSRLPWFSLADFGIYFPRQSSSDSILDEIDRMLAAHHRFTAGELDFIINYDIKCRMGREEGVYEPRRK